VATAAIAAAVVAVAAAAATAGERPSSDDARDPAPGGVFCFWWSGAGGFGLETRSPGPHSPGVTRTPLFVVLVAVALGGAAACSSGPPAVRTFEDFYAATVARDVATVRSLLCATERRALANVPDDELVRAFSVVKVLRRVALESESDAAAVVVAEDALGKTTRVRLRSDLQAPRGWCVAGPVAGDAP